MSAVSPHLTYDVIIVGSGIVGLTLACALAEQGLRLALVDTHVPTFIANHRVSAITHTSQRIFTALRVWDALSLLGVSPYRHMVVWDTQGQGSIQFDHTQIHRETLGHIIENTSMQRVLWERVQACEDIHLFCPVELTTLKKQAGGVTLDLHDGRALNAHLVVGADGAQSWVRTQVGIALKEKEYGQSAIIATVQTEKSHQETAWQCFSNTGTLAFLPLHDPHQSSIVWSTTPEEVDSLLKLNAVDFQSCLAEKLTHRLGAVTASSALQHFPLRMRHAQTYVQAHIALIGDAAHTVHPLAGQGLNLGLLDAACLADVILQARAAHRPIHSYSTLRRYERWRKGHTLAVIALMDGFQQLFRTQQPCVSWFRNLGLQTAECLPLLKQWMIQYAEGQFGELPSLAQSPR